MAHVLVVDDEMSIRETFQVFLEEAGYEVSTAADFFEAEPFLALNLMPSAEQVGGVDVVVADIVLPRVDGLELLRRVSQVNEDIPVVMITGEPDLSTAAEAVRLGAYDYISKPVTHKVLLRVVKRAAERKQLLDEKRRLEQENWAYQAELEQKVLERTAELAQRNRELSTLIDIGRDMSSTLDLEQVLRRISQRTALVCGAYRCFTLLLSRDGELSVSLVGRMGDVFEGSETLRIFTEQEYQELLLQIPEVQLVLETREPMSLQTPDASPMLREWLESFGVVSLLIVPVVSKKRVIGLMMLDHIETEHTFTSEQIDLAVGIAGQAAVAIENARLFQEERRHASLLAVVSQVARQVVSILDLEHILSETVQAIKRRFGYSNVLLCLLDAGSDSLVVRATAGDSKRLVKPDYRQSLGVGIMGKTAETRRPYLVNDVSKDPYYVAGYSDQVLTRSELCVPLIVGGKVIGVLDVQDAELNAFDRVDQTAMEMLADQIAVAIENARLYEATRRHVDALSALHNIDIAITSVLDSDEILHVVYEQVQLVMDFTSFFIGLYDEDEDQMHLVIVAERGDLLSPLSYRCAERGGLSSWVVHNREPLWVGDLQIEREDLPAQVMTPGSKPRSLMILPLIVQDRVLGVISAQSEEPYAFTNEDRRLFLGIAVQVAIAIQNAQLFEALNRRLAESRLLQDIVAAAASTLDFDEILARTIDKLYKALHKTLDIAHLTFAIPDEREQQLRVHSSQIGNAKGAVLPLDKSVSGQVYQSGEPYLIPDVSKLPHYFHSGLEMGSELTVPVKVGGEVVAVLDVESLKLAAFNEDDLHLFSSIAAQLGVALEKTRLYLKLEEKTEELLRAYNELQETTRLRTELVQNVNHELRTPLSLIQGYTELLLEGVLGPLSDKQIKALDTVRAWLANLSRLIYNLTMLQSIPRVSLDLGAVSVTEIVRQRIEEFRHYAEDSGIVFEDKMPEQLPPVRGDWERLILVFGHLVENAIKFSPDGGTVKVQAWERDEHVQVSISDEGIGIPSEHLDRIFERFYQVDGSASRRFGGMGVGLALVWEIVEAHDGMVVVESDPGVGSTFTVLLPLAGPEFLKPEILEVAVTE